MAPKALKTSKHQQNQYGLSFPGMIILAIQNSANSIAFDFCNRALSTKDIYKFLRAHVKPFQAMDAKQWNTTERKIRHSLSQTAYFQRYQPPTETHPDGRVVPSKMAGAEKGSLWTISPPEGKSHDQTQKMVNKVFVEHRVNVFKEHLVNPLILDQIINGVWGWQNPYGESLGNSEEKFEKLKKTTNSSEKAVSETPGIEIQNVGRTQEMPLESSESSVPSITSSYSQMPSYPNFPHVPYPNDWTKPSFDFGHPLHFNYAPFPDHQQVPMDHYSELNQVQLDFQDPFFWTQSEEMSTQEVPMWPPAYFSQSEPSQKQNLIQESEGSPVFQDLDQAPSVAESQQKELGDPLDGDFELFGNSFFAKPDF
ncbi:hypothetical protein L596_018326 [Steinernema carpocapsae]|uniref:Fork-head domain-containing protein n=1 Tax=Steinernema carpocapsae TaxID=34508 RepID=A0A4U5N5B7_STECR|nr:hypothetical protein L596_018326 [Steinernema carpocapsae]